jgi:hypothetical protein
MLAQSCGQYEAGLVLAYGKALAIACGYKKTGALRTIGARRRGRENAWQGDA